LKHWRSWCDVTQKHRRANVATGRDAIGASARDFA
jgi:hypothetical protein